jgi:putative sigma-54 modulation protein
MRLHLTGRNVEVTPALRQLLSRKLSRLERLLQDAAVSAQVVLTRERYRHVTDITLHARGDHMLSGVGSAPDWPESMSLAIEKITQQAQRLKEKWTTRKRRASGRRGFADVSLRGEPEAPTSQAPPGPERVRYPIRRHTLRAALVRLDKTSDGFVLFRHDETMRLSLLFKRRDGSVALIDPEA